MIILGLTGSIAMGKSTVGSMMKTLHIPVHESDHAAHKLLKRNSEARAAIAAAFPIYEYPDIYDRKTFDIKRKELGVLIFNNAEHRAMLESIMHPLVREDQQDFLRKCRLKGHKIVCLDIPLLFETHAQKRVDYTLTVSAPYLVQKQRVMSRPNMNEEKFHHILERQLPDSEKCRRADYVIKTGLGRAHTMKALKNILIDIRIKSGLLPDPAAEVEEVQDYK
tara:strand:- start:24978 stop:25643 length:666 start_codon:yes stop_codon:yes gene_type:complete